MCSSARSTSTSTRTAREEKSGNLWLLEARPFYVARRLPLFVITQYCHGVACCQNQQGEDTSLALLMTRSNPPPMHGKCEHRLVLDHHGVDIAECILLHEQSYADFAFKLEPIFDAQLGSRQGFVGIDEVGM